MKTTTNTERTLMPSSWAGVEGESVVGPGRKPRLQPYDVTAPSEEDLVKIKMLILERKSLPKGCRKERLAIGTKIWFLRHPGFVPNKTLADAAKNKWLKNNRDKRKRVALDWYYRNRGPLKTRVLVETPVAIRLRKLRKKSIQFTLKDRLRVIMGRALRRKWINKSLRTVELIGCTVEELKLHVESRFQYSMTWENRHLWHVDHEVPIIAFDLTDVEEQKAAFNWKNLRPLWAHQNQSKQASIPNPLPSWLPSHIADRIKLRSAPPANP